MTIIKEHSITLDLQVPLGDVHRRMEIFYNPQMASNRNISITLINASSLQQMSLMDPLAGSGIRSLRFLQELAPGKIQKIFVNDHKEHFSDIFNCHLRLNNLKTKNIRQNIRKNIKKNINPGNIIVGNEDAELFLLSQHTPDFCGYFDYIDLDPFGSPNPFLAAAVERIKKEGILAVTATDTAALTGTYPKVTRRKYWAEQVRNYLMHETGLRILIRKIQLQGIQFDKALIPILAYHKDHYFRVYFRSDKGKVTCDELLRKHQYFLLHPKTGEFSVTKYPLEKQQVSGPLWTGSMVDRELLDNMVKNNPFPEEQRFLELLQSESTVDSVGFYDLHVLAKRLGKEPPRMEIALKRLKGVRTHFSVYGVKTEKGLKEVLGLWG